MKAWKIHDWEADCIDVIANNLELERAEADSMRFQAEREAALQSGREDALRRGLLFDTGPCPF